ncbi:MAG: hypothetical protein ABSG43_05975 [Solirubrobacteraceae bacterium]|jgi:hypothetical protein
MQLPVRELVAALTVLGGVSAGFALALATPGRRALALARHLACAVLALGGGAALVLAGAAGPVALLCAAVGCALALAAVGRHAHRRDVCAGGPLALATVRSAGLVPAIRAPVLVLVPDVGGPGVELCQN